MPPLTHQLTPAHTSPHQPTLTIPPYPQQSRNTPLPTPPHRCTSAHQLTHRYPPPLSLLPLTHIHAPPPHTSAHQLTHRYPPPPRFHFRHTRTYMPPPPPHQRTPAHTSSHTATHPPAFTFATHAHTCPPPPTPAHTSSHQLTHCYPPPPRFHFCYARTYMPPPPHQRTPAHTSSHTATHPPPRFHFCYTSEQQASQNTPPLNTGNLFRYPYPTLAYGYLACVRVYSRASMLACAATVRVR